MAPLPPAAPWVALNSLLDRLTTSHGPSRVRQLRWVSRELAAFDADPEGIQALNLMHLLSTPYLNAYLAHADAGLLRDRRQRGLPSPVGTQQARRVCLRILADAAVLPRPDLPPPGTHMRPLFLPDSEARRALALLVSEAVAEPARPSLIRATLAAALVHCHNLRVGELAALRIEDLRRQQGRPDSLTYIPDPPHGMSQRMPVAIDLDTVVSTLLDLWLPVRTRLVAAADNRDPDGESRTHTLLVSVHGNHRDGDRRPAGLPVQPRGLARAHARVVTALNAVLAERGGAHDPDWSPLPLTLGAFRPTGPRDSAA